MVETATDAAVANREMIKRGYDAFQTGNLDLLRDELFDRDIVWHVTGRNQLAGDFRGVDAVLALFVKQFEMTNGTQKVELHDILSSDDHAVALATVSGEVKGTDWRDNYVHVCHFRDGKLTESWIVDHNPYQADELFG